MKRSGGSPVAIGVVEWRKARAIARAFSGGQISSANSRLSGSISRKIIAATVGLGRA